MPDEADGPRTWGLDLDTAHSSVDDWQHCRRTTQARGKGDANRFGVK
jgi:hypothetical protein